MIPLKVALLWHQHQPLYRSPRSGRYSLPWVRLHGLKDYYDMAALAGEFEHLRLTINLVPSLLDQLADYAAGTAKDPALDLARRPAGDLDDDDRLALFDLFFSVPYRTLILPYRRYAALFHKRGGKGPAGDYRDALSRFKEADLRDLQVWFHLAWSGRTLRERREVRDLMRKGEGFSEEEKGALLDLQQDFLKEVVPMHRKLKADGIAEIATSPYYHPILPLLCDLESAREAVPQMPLPESGFRRPADAALQIRHALEFMQDHFGERPAGMWPSEGGLSVDALRTIGEAGLRWTASDEDVLKSSAGRPLSRRELCMPWRVDAAGERCPAIFFRNRELSDLIGFSYSTWPAEDAAADFMRRLREAGADAEGGVVSVILDGENAWEHYPANATDFLRALYRQLSEAEDIRTVTFSGVLNEGVPVAALPHLRAGSWIGASFSTWIGHPEKNRAWTLLATARRVADELMGASLAGSPVQEGLMAAEGSDWFWWFGDDHASEQDAIFDASFRDLLRGVYEEMGAQPPAELDQPIKRVRARSWADPTGPIHPSLDGHVSDYFEWLYAGTCESGAGQGSMHMVSGLLRRLAFGSDGSSLFVRIDPEHATIAQLLDSLDRGTLAVEIVAPVKMLVMVGADQIAGALPVAAGAVASAGSVLEIAVPLPGSAPCEFFVWLGAGGGMLQRLPHDGFIRIVPDQQADWSV